MCLFIFVFERTIKVSDVWQIFKKDDVSLKIVCTLCNKQYANSGSSTTNMWNHLKFKHKSKCVELDQIRKGFSRSVFSQGLFVDKDE